MTATAVPCGLRHTVLGNPANRRIAFFQAALARQGLPAANVIAYRDLLDGHVPVATLFADTDVLRIESPGEDFEVEQRLIARGAGHPQLDRCEQIDSAAALALEFDKGRLRFTRQWYLGYCRLLEELEAERQRQPAVRLHNTPRDIALMFEKPATQRVLRDAGVPIPEMLEPVADFDELLARSRERGWNRVFVKIANSSSASGVVALDLSGPAARAVTTVEIARTPEGVRLYNNLQIQTHVEPDDVRLLIDYLCRETVQVEQWLPKASLDGRMFDLRIVVIGGRARQVVVRTSAQPMTNLHLGNRRGDLPALQARVGSSRWADILATAERAAAAFGNSLYMGVDVLVLPGCRESRVLEVNAFGDLLPRVESEGQDTYESEIATCLSANREPG